MVDDVDIMCSRFLDRESIRELDDAIEQAGLNREPPTILYQRSLEVIGTVSVVLANAFVLAHLLGIRDYLKARMQERGKIDAQRAGEKRKRREAAKRVRSSQFVNALSKARGRGIEVWLSVHIPPEKFRNGQNNDHYGGLTLVGKTVDEVADEIEVLSYYLPDVLRLIDKEVVPEPTLGGVFMKVTGDGLQMFWTSNGVEHTHTVTQP